MFLHAEDCSLVTNGRKEKLEEIGGNGVKAQLSPFETHKITLRLMGEIAAGEPMENHAALDWDYIQIPKAFLHDRHDSYCALRVNGDSMKPRINHGDIVVIHQRSDWDNLDRCVCAVRTSDGITLKKVQYDPIKGRSSSSHSIPTTKQSSSRMRNWRVSRSSSRWRCSFVFSTIQVGSVSHEVRRTKKVDHLFGNAIETDAMKFQVGFCATSVIV